MKIKRFVGKDSRSVNAQIRAEFGPDAVVLSSQEVNGNLEIVAAVDLNVEGLAGSAAPVAAPAQGLADEGYSELYHELASLRQQLLSELAKLNGGAGNLKAANVADALDRQPALKSRLLEMGLSARLCDQLIREMGVIAQTRDGWAKALRLLTHKITEGNDQILGEGGIYAMLGSTGVGKTTTIAKLAARFVMREGRNQIGLITTDCYRIGGQEQLQSFANYLRIPLKVATTAEELKAALASFKDKKLILIDTAGMGQRDVRLYQQYETLAGTGYDIKPYLVLSATSQNAVMREVVQVFNGTPIAGTVVTKLDEAVSLGGVLDTLVSNGLKLGYLSEGQRVPEDITLGRAASLVGRAAEATSTELADAPALAQQIRMRG